MMRDATDKSMQFELDPSSFSKHDLAHIQVVKVKPTHDCKLTLQ